MQDSIAMNVLYILTNSDIERGWILATNECKNQLQTMQTKGNKKDVRNIILFKLFFF